MRVDLSHLRLGIKHNNSNFAGTAQHRQQNPSTRHTKRKREPRTCNHLYVFILLFVVVVVLQRFIINVVECIVCV